MAKRQKSATDPDIDEEAGADADAKVLEGRDGWLFLANDRNDVLGQHTGERLFDAKQLEGWQALLEQRKAFCETLGIKYFLFVAPDAHSVYPEKLPPEVTPAADRPVLQLRRRLSESGVGGLVYPLEEMNEAKADGVLYSTTDSHWNARGAFVAYQSLLDAAEPDIGCRRLTEADIEFTSKFYAGDLGRKVVPRREAEVITATVREPQGRQARDNLVKNSGRTIEFACEAAPPGCCLVLGDSFSYAMLRYLAESFRRFVFGHVSTLDRREVERSEPQVVIHIMAERFLWRVPNDEKAPTLKQHAKTKRRKGQTLESARSREALSRKLLWP